VSPQPLTEPLAYADVFVDDFIGLVQGSQRHRKAFRHTLLHAIDKVFAQPTDKEPNRQEAALVKKLKRDNGALTTQKLILGWILDTLRKTLELANHCPAILVSLFVKLSQYVVQRGRRRLQCLDQHSGEGLQIAMIIGI